MLFIPPRSEGYVLRLGIVTDYQTPQLCRVSVSVSESVSVSVTVPYPLISPHYYRDSEGGTHAHVLQVLDVHRRYRSVYVCFCTCICMCT